MDEHLWNQLKANLRLYKFDKSRQERLLYLVTRLIQRLLLFLTVFDALVYWITLISVAVSVSAVGSLQNHAMADSMRLNSTIERTLRILSWQTLRVAALCLLVTLALRLFPWRQEQHRTRRGFVFDVVLLLVFCVLSVIFAQPLVRSFVGNLS
jgi:hypothetical protein